MSAQRVLLIVDLQAAFAVPPKLVAQIETFSQRFDRRIFTRFVNPPGSFFRRKLGFTSCGPGSPDLRLLIEPGPRDLVLNKPSYGLTPAQVRRLRDLGIRRVTVCGIETDACVLGVQFSLFDGRIDARVVERLCWSAEGLHDCAVRIMRRQFPKPHAAK